MCVCVGGGGRGVKIIDNAACFHDSLLCHNQPSLVRSIIKSVIDMNL